MGRNPTGSNPEMDKISSFKYSNIKYYQTLLKCKVPENCHRCIRRRLSICLINKYLLVA